MPGDVGRQGVGARLKVWDLPVRVVHWLLAILIVFSWWSANNDHLDWHRLSGYTILGLVVFRLYWGFAGSETARFANFLRGPRTVAVYARHLIADKTGPSAIGHNPMGAWSIVAMLTALVVQVTLGLFSVDVDGVESGPLASYISFDQGRMAAHWHHFVFNIVWILVALHILAVLYYAVFRRDNLLSAMVTGWRLAPDGSKPVAFAPIWRLLIGVVLAAAIAWWIAHSFHL
jgi:cytochrome b